MASLPTLLHKVFCMFQVLLSQSGALCFQLFVLNFPKYFGEAWDNKRICFVR